MLITKFLYLPNIVRLLKRLSGIANIILGPGHQRLLLAQRERPIKGSFLGGGTGGSSSPLPHRSIAGGSTRQKGEARM